MRYIRRLARLHVDIPTGVFVLLVVILAYKPLARLLFAAVGWADRELDLPRWVGGFTLNLLSDVIAAIIVATVLVLVLGLRKKAELVGTFDAFDIDAQGNETSWGQVDLTYNVITNRVKGVLKHDDIEIEIEGVLERPYLRGHYAESSNIISRRLGGFLLELNGEGKIYSGRTAYVDTKDENDVPQVGSVKWVRRSKS